MDVRVHACYVALHACPVALHACSSLCTHARRSARMLVALHACSWLCTRAPWLCTHARRSARMLVALHACSVALHARRYGMSMYLPSGVVKPVYVLPCTSSVNIPATSKSKT